MLRSTVVPDAARAPRPAPAPVSIWSAACSSGQEAVHDRDAAGRARRTATGRSVDILATDISAAMLERTREAGRYSQLEVNRGLPAPMLVQHFTQRGTEWQVVGPAARAMVHAQHAQPRRRRCRRCRSSTWSSCATCSSTSTPPPSRRSSAGSGRSCARRLPVPRRRRDHARDRRLLGRITVGRFTLYRPSSGGSHDHVPARPSPWRHREREVTDVRALVIDDSRTMRAIVLGRQLADLGLRACCRPATARRRSTCSTQAGDDLPDLATVDWNMPVMDGLSSSPRSGPTRSGGAITLMMVTTESEHDADRAGPGRRRPRVRDQAVHRPRRSRQARAARACSRGGVDA